MIRRVSDFNRDITIVAICLFIIGGFTGFLYFESENAQGTDVSGSISTDTTWDFAGSPYIVVDDVTVESGVTLTIEPGVWVTFDGYHSIFVDGNIIAIGTETERIIINSSSVFPQPRDWGNIRIESSGFGGFKYCNISHSDYGITCYSSNNNITYNSFSNNSYGMYIASSSNNNITYNNFWSNPAYGIYLTSSANNIITHNNFWNNANGIYLRTSTDNIIADNNISYNGHGLYLQGSINDTIIDNNISNNGVGISVRDSSYISIVNNNFVNDGVFVTGFQISHYNTHNIPANNVLNGEPLLYYKDTSGIILDGIPVGQVILANCRNIEIRNIYLTKIEVGILVAYSSNIIIANNIIENNNYYQRITPSSNSIGGISLIESSECIIENNYLYDNLRAAISLRFSSNNNIISNNSVTLHEFSGIEIGFSSGNIVIDNHVRDNSYGIVLGSSINNIVIGNNASNNIAGIGLFQSLENVISWNTISSNSYRGIHVGSSSNNNIINNNKISNSEFGILVTSSSNSNIIMGNTILNNYNGTYIEDSPNGIITNNVISNNVEGVIVRKSPNSEITANIISSNDNNGIYVFMSPNSNVTSNDVSNNVYGISLANMLNVLVRNNNVSYNDYGIFINSVIDSLIYHNNMINNANQAYDNTNNVNRWNNSYPDGGNYWSDFDEAGEGAYDDYQGPDQNLAESDGIVDIGSAGGGGKNPYVIDLGSQDIYPLISPMDISPPSITNLQPPDGSITGVNTPTISADYSDPSGINVSSVILKVDGIDVTISSIVTASGVIYIPAVALTQGFHIVYLEVKDNADNLATAFWTFTVDNSPPTISNLQPPDATTTNDNTPMIGADYHDPSGINESSVVLKVDGIDVTLSSTVTTSGVSYIPGAALSDNIHSVYLEVKDIYGYLATVTWSFTVDTLPPIITNLQPPDTSTTNDSTPTLSADYSDTLGIDVNSVVLMVNGVDVTSSATVTAGDVSYLPVTALPDGIHTVYLEVKDNAGNLATATWSFTVDSTPPTITNLQPPDASTTNNTIPIISADYSDPSGINVSNVLLEVDSIDVTSFATITASNVSFIPGTVLPDGIHTVYLEVRDIYGNLATTMWNFTVDTLAPIVTNLQPPDDSTTNDNTPTLSADYSDSSGINVSTVVMKVDGIDVTSFALITVSDVSYIPGTALSDGIHTIYLEVKDIYGNLATVSWSFTVDITPPIITNLQPPNTSTINDNTPTISADYSDSSGINVSSVILEVDGIDITSFAIITTSGVSYIPVMALSDGVHTVYLEVIDNVGILATATWTFIVDTIPPTINNLQPPDVSITNDSTPMIGADYNDPSGVNLSSVLLEVDGIDITLPATVMASNVSYIPGVPLSDGIHTIYLEVKDNVNNLATTTWSFTVDATPPIISNLQPPNSSTTNDSTPIIGGNYTDTSDINLSSIILEIDGENVTPFATVMVSGVSYIPGTLLLDGIHMIYLEVRDNAGNLATVKWSFTVDTALPLITNLQPPDLSMTNDSTPTISADYSDLLGINMSSVLLKVDGVDVTSFAVVTASDVNYTPGTALSDEIHTVYLEVKDIYGNLAIASWSFTVETVPPITSISPDNYIVKSGTLFTLTANDGVAGSGVNYTQYKIDDDNWIDYSAPFSIDIYGYHNITYRSVDNLGNIENEKTLSIYVPEIPITTISIGSPQYGTTPRYVNYSTQFSFSVIDYSGLCYDTYYYIDNSPPILYAGSFKISTEGAHIIYYYSIDKLGNIEDMKQIDIIVDNTPPTTTIAIGDPHYVSGDTWVTSSSEITLSAADGGLLPVGIDHTQYRIWNGAWSEWSIYQNVFTLGINDGIRYLEYYCIDWLGNMESINNRTYIVDNTPPTATILFEGPSYRDSPEDILNVTSETAFVFSVYNSGLRPVRFDYIEYRIWNDGIWSDWCRFSGEFNLGFENGTRYLEWYSADKLGNKELTYNLTVFVDNIPPTTEYILQLESDNSEVRISLIPTDIGSGCAFTKYKIDNLTWNIYSNTLVINEPGSHTVYFYAEDNLENTEEQRELTVLIEEPEQSAPPTDDEKDTNNKPLIAFLFAIILLVVGTFVSMKRPLVIVKGNKLSTWLLVVLPFVVAEAFTGVISFFTGILSVPPLFGLGMIVDSIILIVGLVIFIHVFRKQK